MLSKDKPLSDERAVEASQLGQPAQTDLPRANTGYYEPDKLTDLAKHGRLYIIADGLSGPAGGHIASQYAIKKVLHSYFNSDTPDHKARLLEAIQQANLDLFERNSQQPAHRPLATTLTAALIHNNRLILANVGDNQAYVVWGQDIEHIDWTAAPPPPAEPKDAPVLLLPAKSEPPPDKASPAAPSGPALPRLLGLNQYAKIETFSRRLFPADIVILCSGSLTGYITQPEIARAVGRYTPEQAIPRLMALAAERGNRSSVAVSVTRVLSSAVALRPPPPMAAPQPPTWQDWDTTPKPPSAATDKPGDTTATQPLPKTAPAVPPTQPSPMRRFTPPPAKRSWPNYLAGLGLVLLLCALPLIIWQYLIPAETKAAIPFLSNVGTMLAGSPAQNEPAPDTADPNRAAAEPSPTPEVTEANEAGGTPPATLIVESNSPVATPEVTMVSPVSTPSATLTPPQAATPSPTPLPTIVLPQDCTNRARFMQDVTVPDGTAFAPGERFEKVWLLLNAETCPWGPGYTVRFIGGDALGVAQQFPLTEVVQPTTNGEIRVPMIAPPTPGRYRSEWQLYDTTGESFGPVMYVEIEVVPPAAGDLAQAEVDTLYDFIANAEQAGWSANGQSYALQQTEISDQLALPPGQGVVASGNALLRGNRQSEGNVLLTYPDRTVGLIEGRYQVATPLQPTDALVVSLGFPKLAILSDDGVIFEVTFTPENSTEAQLILSTPVQYPDSPVTQVQPLSAIEAGRSGTFTLRVLGRDSLSQDWAVWIDARLIRPK